MKFQDKNNLLGLVGDSEEKSLLVVPWHELREKLQLQLPWLSAAAEEDAHPSCKLQRGISLIQWGTKT